MPCLHKGGGHISVLLDVVKEVHVCVNRRGSSSDILAGEKRNSAEVQQADHGRGIHDPRRRFKANCWNAVISVVCD